jgi:hypothetical protein
MMPDLHCHGQRPLFRIPASERHPSDVQGMGKRPESLRPDDTKVSYAPHVDLGKDPVEHVSHQVEAHPSHDCLSPCVPGIARQWKLVSIRSTPRNINLGVNGLTCGQTHN